jgi:hypothetical protein
LLIPLVGGTWIGGLGLAKLFGHTPPNDGVPVGMNFFLGSVMLLSASGDIRMLARGGVFGKQRLVRHLWRMCFGVFIAAGSFLLWPLQPSATLALVRRHWATPALGLIQHQRLSGPHHASICFHDFLAAPRLVHESRHNYPFT